MRMTAFVVFALGTALYVAFIDPSMSHDDVNAHYNRVVGCGLGLLFHHIICVFRKEMASG